MNEPKKLHSVSIPGYIANRSDLTRTEKYIFGIVNGLAFKEGHCFASNYYLALKTNCCERTIERTIVKIKNLKLWSVKLITYTKKDKANPNKLGTKRFITPFQLGEMSGGGDTSVRGVRHQCQGGGDTNGEHSIKDSIKGNRRTPPKKNLKKKKMVMNYEELAAYTKQYMKDYDYRLIRAVYPDYHFVVDRWREHHSRKKTKIKDQRASLRTWIRNGCAWEQGIRPHISTETILLRRLADAKTNN